MGRLNELLGQRVYLDTNIIIYIVEGNEKFDNILNSLLAEMSANRIIAVTSEITIAEALVKPFQTKSQPDQDAFRAFMSPTRNLEMIPILREVLESSAQIRATTKLKLPDAIHWATARIHNCDSFLTNDHLFSNVDPNLTRLISELTF